MTLQGQRLGWLMAAFMFISVTHGYAADFLPEPGSWQIGVRSGYSVSSRKVDMVPAHLHIGYTVFKGQWRFVPPGTLEIAAEPFASVITYVTRPDRRRGDLELGGMFPVLTYSFDLGSVISPYIEGGLGMLYTDLRGYNLGGHFAFTEILGAGVTCFVAENLAFTVGGRFRHVSNASLYDDNAGLNSFIAMAGISYFFSQH